MKRNQKGFSIVEILVVIVVIGLLSAAGWFVFNRQNNKTDQPAAAQNSQATPNNETKDDEPSPQPAAQKTKIDEESFSLEIPAGWQRAATEPLAESESKRYRYENKDSGEYFQVDVDWGARGAFYGDYNWNYQVNSDGKTISVTSEGELCVEEDETTNWCPDEEKGLKIWILGDKVNGHTFQFLAGNTTKKTGQDARVFKDIIASFKAK